MFVGSVFESIKIHAVEVYPKNISCSKEVTKMPTGFTPQQIKAAQALASGLSQGKAAKESGVTRITVIRWLKKPEFCRKVQELRGKAEKASDSAFVQTTKEVTKKQVKAAGGITSNDLIEILAKVAKDEECRVADRIRATEVLGRWLGLGESKPYQQPPAVPSKPFGSAEMSHRLDILKSTALVASQFLAEQAIQSASEGRIEQAAAVIAKSFDLANGCVADIPIAANALVKQGFVILTPAEFSKLLPDGQKSSQHLLQPLSFDRSFGWRWIKRKSG
jgi:hypothetical protein